MQKLLYTDWKRPANPLEYDDDTVLTLAVRWKLDDAIHLLLDSGADSSRAIQLLNIGNTFMNTTEAKYLLHILKHRKKRNSFAAYEVDHTQQESFFARLAE